MPRPQPAISRDGRFERYLSHFGTTVPVAEFVANPDKTPLVALRHDVDYSIDVALQLAATELKAGCRASYYVLHTTDYWADPRLHEKCLQLQDWGHEVGLHVNLLAQWYRGEIDDIAGALHALLKPLRKAGLKINGVAAHGDALCYSAGFTNYWLFSDIRPADPKTSENGVTAEGSKANGSSRRIDYPDSGDVLTRADGKTFDLWSLKLADFGLDYEASRISPQHYYSDSGGDWKRSVDPMSADFSKDRSLVLMHPLYWREPQRTYYILSTARSGSKWLSRFLNEATSVTARHEFTLNHRFEDGKPVEDKRTGAGYTDLLKNREEAQKLIEDARGWSDSILTDYAEANVYLERFLDELDVDENTTLIHLHRDPAAVVRSLMQRGWYEVPFDDRHPPIDVDGWEKMSQLEQVCHYVADTNARLAEECHYDVEMEKIVSDLEYLTLFLGEIGITVYPRLAAGVFGERLNQTARFDIAPLPNWPDEDREIFERVLQRYAGERKVGLATRLHAIRDKASGMWRRTLGKITGRNDETQRSLGDIPTLSAHGNVTNVKSSTRIDASGATLEFQKNVVGHVLLGGGAWHGASMLKRDPRSVAGLLSRRRPWWGGWWATRKAIFTLGLELENPAEDTSLRVICISYSAAGTRLGQKDIGILSATWPVLVRHFKPMRGAASFNIAIYKSADHGALKIKLRRFQLMQSPLDAIAGAPPEQVVGFEQGSLAANAKAIGKQSQSLPPPAAN